jgi:hypothetical protein
LAKPQLRALLCAALAIASAAPAEEPGLQTRIARLSCGGTVVTAQAWCYGASGICAREALSFRRTEGSLTVAPHKRLVHYDLPDGRRVDALDYGITGWSCVAGTNGGRYVALLFARPGGKRCGECEYFRLYHPNGRLIAATLRFDADGRPREDARAATLIGEVVGSLPAQALQPVYAR